MNISGLKTISDISQGELSWVIWKFVFISGTLEKAGFWTIWVCSFHPNTKSVLARLGRTLHVLFLPLSGSDWRTSFSSLLLLLLLLLLLKGEFTSHVSLSETSLKLPPSGSKSFKISLILSAPIKFLWSKFWTRTQSGIFHIACEARNIIWLVRPLWYLDLHAERGGIMLE